MPSAEWSSFLYLYHCGVNGLAPEAPAELPDGERLLALADRQAAAGVIACALRGNEADWLPLALGQRLRLEAASRNLRNRQRMEAALELIAQLQKRGFPVTVLKGMALGVLYRYPESRSSSDTDLLISPSQEQEVLAAMAELGCRVEPRSEHENHSKCTHPEAGLLEVHVALFGRNTARALGRGKGPALGTELASARLWDREFQVLSPEQSMLFLALHLVKHAVISRMGLRLFYDTALYFARNRDAVNAPQLWAELDRLGASDFFRTVLSMLVRAGCFAESDFPGLILQPEELCDRLAEDIEAYDRMDQSTGDRAAIRQFQDRQLVRLQGGLRARLTKWKESERRRVLFPPARMLARQYPVLDRCSWLYPAIWTYRAARGVLDPQRRTALGPPKTGAEERPSQPLPPEHDRSALLLELGLLDRLPGADKK